MPATSRVLRPERHWVWATIARCSTLQPACNWPFPATCWWKADIFWPMSARTRWATRPWLSTSATWPLAVRGRWLSRWHWLYRRLTRPGYKDFQTVCGHLLTRTAASWWVATPHKARSTFASRCLARCRAARRCCVRARSPATISTSAARSAMPGWRLNACRADSHCQTMCWRAPVCGWSSLHRAWHWARRCAGWRHQPSISATG